MHDAQRVLLVADKESLARTYDLACTTTNSDVPTMASGALRMGMSRLGLSKAVRSNKNKEQVTAKNLAISAFIPGGLALLGTKVALSNVSKEASDLDLDMALTKIQHSLGIATKISYVPLDEAHSIPLSMGQMCRNNCFYISHPIKNNLFIPLQDYNKLLAKEKNNVFMELAAALGAKSIHLEDASSYNSKGNAETDFNLLKPVAMDIGINVNFDKDGNVKKEVCSSFNKPKVKPEVPSDLQKWVDIDSDLSLMVKNRLKYGSLSHQISLHFKDSLDGAAEVAAKITGTNKGIGIKSSAAKSISSTWVFNVEYHSTDN